MMNLFKSKKDLFEFKHGDKTWYLTSASKAVEHNGHTYLPLVVGRSDITDEDIDKCDTEITFPYPMQILNAEGDDLQALFLNKIYFTGVTCTVLELLNNETLVLFQGRVTLPDFDNSTKLMTLTCSTEESYQRRNILTRKFQRTCLNNIYDRFCGLSFDEWAVEVTVTAISGANITFTVNDSSTYEMGYFNRGLLKKDGIFTFINLSNGGNLQLYRPHFGLQVGDVVLIAPGCDQSFATCRDKFGNNLRYMGHQYIPLTNPVNDQIIK